MPAARWRASAGWRRTRSKARTASAEHHHRKPDMILTRRGLLASATLVPLAAPSIVRAQGNTPIRVGEINSYTAVPAFTLPYRNGWTLDAEQVNAAGGALGRQPAMYS